ncbi:MAG: phosphatase PAP2 family protein [Bacteroidales bacterium]|nr:phosphatase PAP2 family protein [Bacteroidales bacterium]
MNRTFAPYVFCYLILLAVMGAALIAYPKTELHLLLNTYHSGIEDIFFRYFTVFAEWPVYVIALLPLLFWKAGWTYLYVISEILSGLTVFILKRLFAMPRPAAYFKYLPQKFPVVDGVNLHHAHSFPSGHTATFFVAATLCALLIAYFYSTHKSASKRSYWRWFIISMLLLPPAFGGYSRVYLSQHFLLDVFVGSMIGFTVPCLVFWYFERKGWLEAEWFDRSLFGRRAYFKGKRE